MASHVPLEGAYSSCWMRKHKDEKKLRVSALPAKVLNVGMLPTWALRRTDFPRVC